MRSFIAVIAGVMLAAGLAFPTAAPAAPASSSPRVEHPLFGVACKSQKSCVAVGDAFLKNDNTAALAESWNGKTWTAARAPVPAGAGTAVKYCLAVGNGGVPGHSQGTPSSDVWNGRAWALKHVPVPPNGGGVTANSTLQGTSCLSATDCVAAGELDLGNGEQQQYGFSGFWNGNAWRLAATA